MPQLRIGTSGWNYQHWRERFYPQGVGAGHWLEYYSQFFSTAEVNYSFYKLPKPSTYRRWIAAVPSNFIFTLKCSRLITHNKRLGNLGDLWENFLRSAFELKKHLGPILFQLPETFELDSTRLDEFLDMAVHSHGHHKRLRLAIEFRHESWLCPIVYRLLERYNVALVAADSSRYPRVDRATADFFYLRYHGPKSLFGSNYSRQRLDKEAAQISKLLAKGMDVYAYFNNDGFAFAVKNALALSEMLSPEKLWRTS